MLSPSAVLRTPFDSARDRLRKGSCLFRIEPRSEWEAGKFSGRDNVHAGDIAKLLQEPLAVFPRQAESPHVSYP
jgi:hypothetical protein